MNLPSFNGELQLKEYAHNFENPSVVPKKSHVSKMNENTADFDEMSTPAKDILNSDSRVFNACLPSISVTMRSSEEITTVAKLNRGKGSLEGKIEQKIKLSQNQMSLELDQNKNATLSVKNNAILPNLSFSAKMKTDLTCQSTLLYKHRNFALNTALNKSGENKFTLVPSLSVYFKQFAFGSKMKLSLGQTLNRTLSDYNVAASFVQDKMKYSLFTEDRMTLIKAQALYELCPGLSMAAEVGSDLFVSPKLQNAKFSVGAKGKYSEKLSFHAKASEDGWLQSKLTHHLSDDLSVGVYSGFNILSSFETPRFGMSFDLCASKKKCSKGCKKKE